MDYQLKRRWPRFECIKPVNAKVYWAHNFLPFVSVKLLDISKKGIGFSSSKKLKNVECELKILSFPLLTGRIVYRREVEEESGSKMYKYGFILTNTLNKFQLENLGCRGIINLDNPNGMLS